MSNGRNFICDCNLPFYEQQKQEEQASAYSHGKNIPNLSPNTLTEHRNKQIFSFKYSQFRRYQQSEKFKSSKHTQRKFDLRFGSPQPIDQNLCSPQIITCNLPLKNIFGSSQMIDLNRFDKAFHQEKFLKQNRSHQFLVSKTQKQTNSNQCTSKTVKQLQKNDGKQTRCCSHRQLYFKKSEIHLNDYKIILKENQERNRLNNVIIQETQSSKTISVSEESPPSQTMLENVTPRESVNPMQLMNVQTIQTIMSPNQSISYSPSWVSSQLLTMRAFKETPSAIEQEQQIVKYNSSNDHIPLSSITQDKNAIQFFDYSNQRIVQSEQLSKQQKVKNGLFRPQKINNLDIKSSKVSVIDLHQQGSRFDNDEEELRDVIDSNVPSFSTNANRPSMTILYPKKHVTIETDKFENAGSSLSQFSPQHSRQVSIQEFAMLTKARMNLRRANTVESMPSEQSLISSLDMKFMQQLKDISGQHIIRLV